jgi:hypothetical protein
VWGKIRWFVADVLMRPFLRAALRRRGSRKHARRALPFTTVLRPLHGARTPPFLSPFA